MSKQTEEWDAEDLIELHRMIPDLNAVLSHNPLSQVAFRAGLLACRETMARFVEQGGSDLEKKIGQSIRANWWPSLGDDPGPPRQLEYSEVTDEKLDGSIGHKDISPSVEALPRAWSFINHRTEDKSHFGVYDDPRSSEDRRVDAEHPKDREDREAREEG